MYSSDEKREMRVFTKRYPVSANLIHLFNSTDCHVISNLIAKSAMEDISTTPIKMVQERVLSRLESLMLAFKKLVCRIFTLAYITQRELHHLKLSYHFLYLSKLSHSMYLGSLRALLCGHTKTYTRISETSQSSLLQFYHLKT